MTSCFRSIRRSLRYFWCRSIAVRLTRQAFVWDLPFVPGPISGKPLIIVSWEKEWVIRWVMLGFEEWLICFLLRQDGIEKCHIKVILMWSSE